MDPEERLRPMITAMPGGTQIRNIQPTYSAGEMPGLKNETRKASARRMTDNQPRGAEAAKRLRDT